MELASLKLLLASIAIALVIVGARSDASAERQIAEPEPAPGSALRSEIDGLRSKISALESSIEERIVNTKNKEDSIARLDAIIQEKLSAIASLEREIKLLQEKGAIDAKKLVGKADARVADLEKQIMKLRTYIEGQSKKRDALATRVSEAETKCQELSRKLESLQRTNEEQKLRVRKTQRALELAEEELMKAQAEATSKLKELSKVHGAWLPSWLVTYTSHIQDFVVTEWNEHVKPALVLFMQKASEKLEQAQEWAEPHLNSAKAEWIPAAKEQLLIFKSNAEPYMQMISSKTFELYETSKSMAAPHFLTLQEAVYPYYQEARRLSEPYILQVATATKPHIEKLKLVMKPYTKHIARGYRRSLRTARTYHRQVQDNIHEKLKKHELTEPYATQELAWFMASALLALPVFFLFRVLAAAFCGKAKKPRRTTNATRTHRRPKRRHTDK